MVVESTAGQQVRASCPACLRDDILVNKGGVMPTLRKHKAEIFRGRDADGNRQALPWCKGSGRPA